MERNLMAMAQRILLADDRADAREMMSVLLKTIGYQKIDYVNNGGDILEALRVQHYDFIIMEVGITTEITAEEIVDHVNEQWSGVDQPVIIAVVSDKETEQNKNSIVHSGISDLIEEPLTYEKIKAVMGKR